MRSLGASRFLCLIAALSFLAAVVVTALSFHLRGDGGDGGDRLRRRLSPTQPCSSSDGHTVLGGAGHSSPFANTGAVRMDEVAMLKAQLRAAGMLPLPLGFTSGGQSGRVAAGRVGGPGGTPVFDGTTCEIPRIIHQTWKGRRVDARFAGHIRSWVDVNPGWKHWFWTDRDNRNLVATRFPSFLKLWDALPQNIMRADLVRYFIMWEFGGVYVDLDFEALRPMDRLVEALRQQAGSLSRGRTGDGTRGTGGIGGAGESIGRAEVGGGGTGGIDGDRGEDEHSEVGGGFGGGVRAGRPDTNRGGGAINRRGGPGCILGQEPWVHAHVLYNADRLICNAIMMSCPGHPVWRVVVDLAQARWDSGKYRHRVLSLTGPKLLNDAVGIYVANHTGRVGGSERSGRSDRTGRSGGSNSGSGSVRVGDGGGGGGDSSGGDGGDGGAIMASDVVVMPPDTFYPHVDYANGDIKKKCRRRALDKSCNTTLSSHQCIRRRAACDVARGHNFTSPTPGHASFAAHHWTHTWLSGPMGANLDTSPCEKVLVEHITAGEAAREGRSGKEATLPKWRIAWRRCLDQQEKRRKRAAEYAVRRKQWQQGGQGGRYNRGANNGGYYTAHGAHNSYSRGGKPGKPYAGGAWKHGARDGRGYAPSAWHAKKDIHGVEGDCMGDRKRLCGHVKPGGGATHRCMIAHITNTSAACRKVLDADKNDYSEEKKKNGNKKGANKTGKKKTTTVKSNEAKKATVGKGEVKGRRKGTNAGGGGGGSSDIRTAKKGR